MTTSPRRRRARPSRLLGAGLLLLLILEILAISLVSSWIGGWPTFLLLMLTSALGVWVISRQGARAWRALNQALLEGRMPARELADGIVVLVGGLLLLLPGFITDLAGLLLVLPFTRPVARSLLAGAISSHLIYRADHIAGVSVTEGPQGPGGPPLTPEGPQRSQASGEIIEGQVVEGHIVEGPDTGPDEGPEGDAPPDDRPGRGA